MDTQDLLNALSLGEDKDWEFKSAKGGLPGSMWESYSAMANTDGGAIVLGVREKNDSLEIHGVDDPAKMEKDFWSTINNPGHVSRNLLANSDIQVHAVDGKSLLLIQVPRATRTQRPIFVGQNPLGGTYRRFNEGDYKCTDDEVGRMLADQSEHPADSRVLSKFSLDDLDKRSLGQYRNRFATRSPAHAWLGEDDRGLLQKLGGWRHDRETDEQGITVAGLLMFGKDEAINDPLAISQFHIDYREHLGDDPKVRWTDRIWPDGTWVANLFQFFTRVYPRLVEDLKIPFQLAGSDRGATATGDPNAVQRIDEAEVHEAIREAFVNALIHGDYRGQGGIIVDRYRDRLEFSNPGTLLLSFEQLVKGGVSECRNKTLQKMFAMIGFGEKAGSGIDKIRQGWKSQKWRWPSIGEQLKPDRVRLVMSMVSLLPEESLARLRAALGEDLDGLDPNEVQALVTADVEESVTNQRLTQFIRMHSSDITKLLQGLVSKGHLFKDGYGRWASYALSDRFRIAENGSTPDTGTTDSGHNEGNSVHSDGNSVHNESDTPYTKPEEDPQLLAIAKVAREKDRLPPETTKEIIAKLCSGRYLTPLEIGALLTRSKAGIQARFLRPMAQNGELELKYPGEPNHPNQAYRATEAETYT